MAENGWNFIVGKWYFANSSRKISQNKWEKINCGIILTKQVLCSVTNGKIIII